MDDDPVRLMTRSQNLDGIGGHLRRRRDIGKRPAVGPTEPELAVRLPIELIALFVNRSMVPATQQGQIRERSGAALSPVNDVMTLTKSHRAARETATSVTVMKCSA